MRINRGQFLQKNFPEMELEYKGIEWSKAFGDYLISFKDKDNQNYSCVIGPKYLPVIMGQGLFEIEDIYSEKYKESNLIEQKIAIAKFIISNNDDKTFISSTDLSLDIKLVDTFRMLINSNLIQNKVREEYPNAGNVELEIIEGTGILKAIYVCDNYSDQECIEIINKYFKIFSERIVGIYNIDNISMLEPASISTRLIEKE